MRRKKFGNILDIPRTAVMYIYSFYPRDSEEANKKYHNELKEREIALYEHYGLIRPAEGIDNQTKHLIRKMAKELGIIGFTQIGEIENVGRPKTWKGKKGLVFWIRVRIKSLKNPKKSLRNIIQLVKNEHKSEYKNNLSDLYKRYNKEVLEKNEQVRLFSELIDGFSESDLVKEYDKRTGYTMSKTEHQISFFGILSQALLNAESYDLSSIYEL